MKMPQSGCRCGGGVAVLQLDSGVFRLILALATLALKIGVNAAFSPPSPSLRRLHRRQQYTPDYFHFRGASQCKAVATTPSPPSLLDEISVTFSSEDNGVWAEKASAVLKKWGIVALVSSDQNSGLIDGEICDRASIAASSRLADMHRRIESRGLDPTGSEELYRFSEIICRDEGGKRYDVPVEFMGGCEDGRGIQDDVGSGRIGTPLDHCQKEAMKELHTSIDKFAKPVVDFLWSEQQKQNSCSYVAASGFLVNEPGSKAQNWHRDGPDEGFIDCFVPLLDLMKSVGPTEIKPGTHKTKYNVDSYNNNEVVQPMLKKGEVLMFDYRTIHRGQGNQSNSTTRTLAYAVYKRMQEGSNDFSGDVHNFPAALTLEYD